MGLRLSSITVSGFGSYGPDPQTVHFNGKGAVAIVGENGAGKSTIVSKALCWCLYGKSAPERMGSGTRTITGKSVLNLACKTVSVEVELANSVDKFKIRRERKKTGSDTLTVLQDRNGEQTELDPNDQTIISIVGVDWFVFTRTVLRGQGDLWSFAEATDKAKRELLDVISGAKVLEEVEQRVKAVKSAEKVQVDKYDLLCSTTEDKLNNLGPTGYNERISSWDAAHAEKVNTAQRELDLANAAELEAIESDKSLQSRKDDYQRVLDNKPHLDMSEYQEAIREADEMYHKALADHRQTKIDLDKISKMAIGTECHTCGQIVEENAPIVHKIEGAKDRERTAASYVEPYEAHRRACQDSLAKAQDWLNQQMISWQGNLKELGSMPALQGPIASRYRKEVEARLMGLKETKNPWVEAHNQIQKQSEELIGDLTEYRNQHKKHMRELEMAEIWLSVLQPKGVRAHLAESALCAIEAKANEWLGVLSDGTLQVEFPSTKEVGGRIKEEIRTVITSITANGDSEPRDLLTFSGGERRRINLAVDLGVASAFGHSDLALSLLILDEEVFSGMDEAGKAAVVKTLHSAGIEDVVIIDHDPRLSSTLPRTIEVSRGPGGFSQIEEKLS